MGDEGAGSILAGVSFEGDSDSNIEGVEPGEGDPPGV